MKYFNVRKITIFFIGIFIILFVVYFVMFIRFRGSVKVYPNKDIDITENFTPYRQDNDLWAGDYLGESSFTMKKSGCLVTCIASAMNVDPKTLNKQFSLHNVYDSEGNLLWGNLKNFDDSYHVEVFSEISGEILMDCLNNNRFPIARVRMHGLGNFHYVLIVKAEDGIFYCMDPLQDKVMPLSEYGNRVYAVRCVY